MNRAILLIITIIIAFFYSCYGPKYRKGLTEADSIASVNPQRAMAMLDSIKHEMADAPENEQMYYRLLCIKAQDKAYIKHTSDSAILPIVEYYETEGDKNLLSEAYYYAGSVYRDLNDAPQALEYYHKTLDITSDNKIPQKGHLYFQVGNLLLNQALYNQAIDMYQKALRLYNIQNDSINTIYTLRNLAYTYNKAEKKDSSLVYYQKAYQLARQTKYKHVKIEVLAQMASVYIEKKNYIKAKECLSPILNKPDSIELSPDYCMALKICMNTGQYDSAHFYAKELLTVGTVYAKQTASRYLTELALKEKNYNNAEEHLKQFNKYTDSVKIITATESVNRMNSLYNYKLREKENLMLKAENAIKKLILTIVISVSFIIFVILITYVYRNRQKLERLGRLRKQLYEQSEEYVRQNKEKIQELEQELKRTSDENMLLIERIEQQRADLILANQTAMRKQARNESSKNRIAATDIYKTIQDHIKKDKVITPKEWETLDRTVNQEVNDFKDNLYSYHRISQHEYHICMLIRLALSPTEMATLLGCTTSAISKARRRLQEKFFSDNGTAKDFDNFINSL